MKSRKYNEYTQPVKDSKPTATPEPNVEDRDDIYTNTQSPQETAPSIPLHAMKNTTANTNPKTKKTSLQAIQQESKESEGEGCYSSLDLSQKEEQDVYEPQLVIKSKDKLVQKMIPENVHKKMPESHKDVEQGKVHVESGQTEDKSLDKLMTFLRNNRKKIIVIIIIFCLTFMASLLGSLVAGSSLINSINIIVKSYFEKPIYSTTTVQPLVNETSTFNTYNETTLSTMGNEK
ncbi:uncharacterized protein LOC106068932 [Biomphalaria glabrata]|uniref:Uncharacterized protein LOC106068932 n=1 Tax=Biomphalaria glabrata TaxID=6526 RepID=A0A2C9LV76_BIOGL|nr:uncharacterized protein LOC106068932 [Biomphalaria glabrata]